MSSGGVKYYLIQKTSDTSPMRLDLSGDEIVVGRASFRRHPSFIHISRRHASFQVSADGTWFIKDLKSTNGVFVNGIKISKGLHPLSVNDCISFGAQQGNGSNELEFWFRSTANPPSDESSADRNTESNKCAEEESDQAQRNTTKSQKGYSGSKQPSFHIEASSVPTLQRQQFDVKDVSVSQRHSNSYSLRKRHNSNPQVLAISMKSTNQEPNESDDVKKKLIVQRNKTICQGRRHSSYQPPSPDGTSYDRSSTSQGQQFDVKDINISQSNSNVNSLKKHHDVNPQRPSTSVKLISQEPDDDIEEIPIIQCNNTTSQLRCGTSYQPLAHNAASVVQSSSVSNTNPKGSDSGLSANIFASNQKGIKIESESQHIKPVSRLSKKFSQAIKDELKGDNFDNTGTSSNSMQKKALERIELIEISDDEENNVIAVESNVACSELNNDCNNVSDKKITSVLAEKFKEKMPRMTTNQPIFPFENSVVSERQQQNALQNTVVKHEKQDKFFAAKNNAACFELNSDCNKMSDNINTDKKTSVAIEISKGNMPCVTTNRQKCPFDKSVVSILVSEREQQNTIVQCNKKQNEFIATASNTACSELNNDCKNESCNSNTDKKITSVVAVKSEEIVHHLETNQQKCLTRNSYVSVGEHQHAVQNTIVKQNKEQDEFIATTGNTAYSELSNSSKIVSHNINIEDKMNSVVVAKSEEKADYQTINQQKCLNRSSDVSNSGSLMEQQQNAILNQRNSKPPTTIVKVEPRIKEISVDFCYSQVDEVITISDDEDYLNFSSQGKKDGEDEIRIKEEPYDDLDELNWNFDIGNDNHVEENNKKITDGCEEHLVIPTIVSCQSISDKNPVDIQGYSGSIVESENIANIQKYLDLTVNSAVNHTAEVAQPVQNEANSVLSHSLNDNSDSFDEEDMSFSSDENDKTKSKQDSSDDFQEKILYPTKYTDAKNKSISTDKTEDKIVNISAANSKNDAKSISSKSSTSSSSSSESSHGINKKKKKSKYGDSVKTSKLYPSNRSAEKYKSKIDEIQNTSSEEDDADSNYDSDEKKHKYKRANKHTSRGKGGKLIKSCNLKNKSSYSGKKHKSTFDESDDDQEVGDKKSDYDTDAKKPKNKRKNQGGKSSKFTKTFFTSLVDEKLKSKTGLEDESDDYEEEADDGSDHETDMKRHKNKMTYKHAPKKDKVEESTKMYISNHSAENLESKAEEAANPIQNNDYFPVLSQNFFKDFHSSNSSDDDSKNSCNSVEKRKNQDKNRPEHAASENIVETNRKNSNVNKNQRTILTEAKPMPHRPKYQRGKEEWFDDHCENTKGEFNDPQSSDTNSYSVKKFYGNEVNKPLKKNRSTLFDDDDNEDDESLKQYRSKFSAKADEKAKSKKPKISIREKVKKEFGHRIRAPNGGSAIPMSSNDKQEVIKHKLPNKDSKTAEVPVKVRKLNYSVKENSGNKSAPVKRKSEKSRMDFLLEENTGVPGFSGTSNKSTFKIPKLKSQFENNNSNISLQKQETKVVQQQDTDAIPQKGTDAIPQKGTDAIPQKGTDAIPQKRTCAIPLQRTDAIQQQRTGAILQQAQAENINKTKSIPETNFAPTRNSSFSHKPFRPVLKRPVSCDSSLSNQRSSVYRPTNEITIIENAPERPESTSMTENPFALFSLSTRDNTKKVLPRQAWTLSKFGGNDTLQGSAHSKGPVDTNQSNRVQQNHLPIPNTSSNSRDPRIKSGNQSLNLPFTNVKDKPVNQVFPFSRSSQTKVPNQIKVLHLSNKFDSEMLIIDIIKNWNPSWLKEYEKFKEPPPIIMKPAALLPLTFNTLDKYAFGFYSLMRLELWENIYTEWRDSSQENAMCLMVTNYTLKGDMMLLECNTFVNHKLMQHLREGALLIVELRENNQKNIHMIFGYISQFRISPKPIPAHTHKEWSRRPEAASRDSDFCIFKLKVKKKSLSLDLDKLMKATNVSYIGNKVRMADIFEEMMTSPITPYIMNPDAKVFSISKTIGRTSTAHINGNFNKQQSHAIISISKEMKSPYLQPKMVLLQGPPGTGKTHTIVGIVQDLLHGDSNKTKILIAAPSNAAVDEIGRRLVHLRHQYAKIWEKKLKMIRIGFQTQIHHDLQNYSFEALTRRNTKISGMREEDALMKNIAQKSKMIKQAEDEISLMNRRNASPNDIQKKMEELNVIVRRKQHAERELRDARMRISSSNNLSDDYACKIKLLKGANIILSTLSSCRQRLLETCFGRKSDVHFTCCIIDEATQCVEPEVLQPLVFGLNKFVLVGDHQQLPATVHSKEAIEFCYERSLFERVHLFFQRSSKNPVFMLTEQYRMHSEICSFPSQCFYSNKLTTNSAVDKRITHGFPLKPFVLLDIIYGQEVNAQYSKTNTEEAKCIIELCKQLVQILPDTMTIGIITPYQAQRHLYMHEFAAQPQFQHIEVNTVDGFQGREKDVIILSCVRARSASGSIGFVACRKRLNVAITRAKRSLIICGHMDSFKGDSNWTDLLDNARRRQCIVPVTDERDLPHILKDIKKMR